MQVLLEYSIKCHLNSDTTKSGGVSIPFYEPVIRWGMHCGKENVYNFDKGQMGLTYQAGQ